MGHEVAHLLQAYGSVVVFAAVAAQAAGAPVPGTTALVVAAISASGGHGPPLAEAIVAAALGALVGTSVGFGLGRWRGEPVLLKVGRRLGSDAAGVDRLRSAFAAHGGAMLVVGRFITVLRNIVGLLAGASGMPVRRFLPICAAAAAGWALVNGLAYYWFGQALTGASTWVQAAVVCLGLVWVVLSVGVLRRQALRRLASAPLPQADAARRAPRPMPPGASARAAGDA